MTDPHEGQVRELVDFDSALWLPDFEPPNPSLIVQGKTRVPMDVTIEQPDVTSNDEYWPTEVVGYHPETTTEVETPYQVSTQHNGTSGSRMRSTRQSWVERGLLPALRVA